MEKIAVDAMGGDFAPLEMYWAPYKPLENSRFRLCL